MKKTRNLIIGGVVTIGVLAAIGAITVARYAAKHMDKEVPDECDCDGDCEHCPMNAPDVEVEIEVDHKEESAKDTNVEVEVPAEENVAEEVPVENVEA